MKSFLDFISSRRVTENSDLDWSDKNWDEAGVDAENPPNSGLEGTSAEQMDYTAGDYGETSDEVEIEEDETAVERTAKSKEETDMIKALIDDLTDRVSNLEKIKQT